MQNLARNSGPSSSVKCNSCESSWCPLRSYGGQPLEGQEKHVTMHPSMVKMNIVPSFKMQRTVILPCKALKAPLKSDVSVSWGLRVGCHEHPRKRRAVYPTPFQRFASFPCTFISHAQVRGPATRGHMVMRLRRAAKCTALGSHKREYPRRGSLSRRLQRQIR